MNIPKKILLVEDNAIIALNQKMQLEKFSYSVTHVINGKDAIAFALDADYTIDLILMDIDLGKGMDGTQAARKILQKRKIPIVFLSSHTEQEVVERTETITSYGYVVKNSGIIVLDASIKMAFKLFYAHKNILKHKSDSDIANKELKISNYNLKNVNKTLKRLERAIENTKDIVFITDTKGIITYINSQFIKIYGYSKEEIIGKENPRILSALDFTDKENKEFWELLRTKHYLKAVFPNKTKNGKLITVETSIDPIFNSNGQLIEFVQIHRDITEKLQVEERLIKNNNSLLFLNTIANEQANSRNIDFLTDMIMQQLESITNAVFVAFSEYQSTEKIMENKKIVANNTILRIVTKIAGEKILNSKVFVDDKTYFEVITERIKTFSTLHECTHGAIGRQTSSLIQNALKIDKIVGLSYFIDEKLYGTSLFALKKGQQEPDREILDSFINISAISIRRHVLEKEQRNGENEISSLKAKRNLLSEDSTMMKAMLNTYEEAIWGVDRNFNFTFMNSYFIREFKEAFNIDLKRGMQAFSKVRPKLRKVWKPQYERALKGEKTSFEFEEDAQRDKHYFRVNLNPIHTEGEITGVSAISVDITKQKIAELKILEKTHQSQQYLDIAGVMFVAINREGTITMVNKKLCEISEYSEDELLGHNWFDLIIPKYMRDEIIPVSKKLLNGEFKPVEYYENPILTKSGKEIIVAWHNILIKDENGNISGHLSSGNDITVRKAAEEKIKKLLTEKELILKEVHHRIKNNMTTLIGLISLQSNSTNNYETQTALLEIENRIRTMMVLYETLFQSVDFESASIKNYLSSLIDNIIGNFPNSKNISVEKDLPDHKLDVKNIFNIGIIINELITNSMKYAFANNSSGKIFICVKCQDNMLILTVEDNGIGIPKKKNVLENSGFGLKLIKMLVSQMEGNIILDTEKRTKFTITLPNIN
jgi:PAS domain S-box-containing protein